MATLRDWVMKTSRWLMASCRNGKWKLFLHSAKTETYHSRTILPLDYLPRLRSARWFIIRRTHKLYRAMFEYEELTDIIGCSCTLLIPYRGRTEGFVVADYGEDIVVKLRNGKEIVERRDDVLVYDWRKGCLVKVILARHLFSFRQ